MILQEALRPNNDNARAPNVLVDRMQNELFLANLDVNALNIRCVLAPRFWNCELKDFVTPLLLGHKSVESQYVVAEPHVQFAIAKLPRRI